MTNNLRGVLALDASTLIDLLLLSDRGKILKNALFNDYVEAYTTELAIVETKYILCRLLGWEEGNKRVNKLLASGYIDIVSTNDLIDMAAKYKCTRNLSLADSLVLSLAKKLGCKAVFARKEKEIVQEMKKENFDVEILFLDSL